MEAKDMYAPSPYPLGIKTVLMGFGLESNAIHSPNENIPLDIFRKGIEAVVEFYLNYK